VAMVELRRADEREEAARIDGIPHKSKARRA
jgi:hypothetical protein